MSISLALLLNECINLTRSLAQTIASIGTGAELSVFSLLTFNFILFAFPLPLVGFCPHPGGYFNRHYGNLFVIILSYYAEQRFFATQQ